VASQSLTPGKRLLQCRHSTSDAERCQDEGIIGSHPPESTSRLSATRGQADEQLNRLIRCARVGAASPVTRLPIIGSGSRSARQH